MGILYTDRRIVMSSEMIQKPLDELVDSIDAMGQEVPEDV